VSVQDRCIVCVERSIGSKIILNAHDGTAGDVGHVESSFGPFGDSANLDARDVNGLCQTYHRLGHRFGSTRWNSSGKRVMYNLNLVHLEIVLLSVQDRCTVCAERTIGSKIILDAHDGTPR
jgi:hypothetical protein